jgi:hypothetical protein
MLDCGWIKEFHAGAVDAATGTERFGLICTSNFCNPQRGMWENNLMASRYDLSDQAGADCDRPSPGQAI